MFETTSADPSDWATLRILDFPHSETIQTRWSDNDIYGHVNNTVHYSVVDSVVNRLLIANSEFRPEYSKEVGLVVSSSCRYYREISYPFPIELGLSISRIGHSSVHYLAGLYAAPRDAASTPDDQLEMPALVQFSHVYSDRDTRQTIRVPDYVRKVVEPLLLEREVSPRRAPPRGR